MVEGVNRDEILGRRDWNGEEADKGPLGGRGGLRCRLYSGTLDSLTLGVGQWCWGWYRVWLNYSQPWWW
jgi:hypothetical protein